MVFFGSRIKIIKTLKVGGEYEYIFTQGIDCPTEASCSVNSMTVSISPPLTSSPPLDRFKSILGVRVISVVKIY